MDRILTPYQIRLRPRERVLLDRMAAMQRRRPQEQAAVLVAAALEEWATEIGADLGDVGTMGEPEEAEPEAAIA